MKESKFVFESVDLDIIVLRNKRATINPKNKKDDNAFSMH